MEMRSKKNNKMQNTMDNTAHVVERGWTRTSGHEHAEESMEMKCELNSSPNKLALQVSSPPWTPAISPSHWPSRHMLFYFIVRLVPALSPRYLAL